MIRRTILTERRRPRYARTRPDIAARVAGLPRTTTWRQGRPDRAVLPGAAFFRALGRMAGGRQQTPQPRSNAARKSLTSGAKLPPRGAMTGRFPAVAMFHAGRRWNETGRGWNKSPGTWNAAAGKWNEKRAA